MVLVDGLKYACAPCIKGHRSSSCTHTDRPLYEIKKKGRPVTQCDHCRQLRKTKQVHVKCSCQADVDNVRIDSPTKAKRKLPTFLSFPNGLKGPRSSASPIQQVQSRSVREASSSSPSSCSCDSSGGCHCATPVTKKSSSSRPSASSDASSIATPPPIRPVSSCCGGKSKHVYDTSQLQTADPDTHLVVSHSGSARDLPQILSPVPYRANDLNHISNIASTASGSTSTFPPMFLWPGGVGTCTCGSTCTCPGCYEHADPSASPPASESCPYACATCSNCYGFGFVSTSDSSRALDGGGTHAVQSSDGWVAADHSDLLPLPESASMFMPVNSQSSLPVSDCCGGSCKCSPQALGCECKEDCCGCCFGCSCSEESDIGSQDNCGVRGRLGFAISGERASCCADREGDVNNDGAHNKRQKTKIVSA